MSGSRRRSAITAASSPVGLLCLLGVLVAAALAAAAAPSLSPVSDGGRRRHRWGVSSRPGARRCVPAGGPSRTVFGSRRREQSWEVGVALRGGAAIDDDDEYDSDSDSNSEEFEETDSLEGYGDSEEEEESESESEEEASESESEEVESDEYDSEGEEEESDEEDALTYAVSSEGGTAADGEEAAVVEYDEMLVQGPFESMGVTIGVMLLSRRLDLNDPRVVRMARFAFVAYLVATQVFLAYVRIRARRIDDRTPVTVQNPLSSVLQSQLQGGNGDTGSGSDSGGGGGPNDAIKNLASSLLSSTTSVVEYDLKQAKSMGNALLMPMVLLWVLHFKMGQVQPLLLQTASGLANLAYSPLFQVYVLGRKLERPFKSRHGPLTTPSPNSAKAEAEAGAEGDEGPAAATSDEEGEEMEEEATGGERDEKGEGSDEDYDEWTASDDEEEDESKEYDEYDSDEE